MEAGRYEEGREKRKMLYDVPTAFSSMMLWAFVFASAMACCVMDDEKIRRKRNMKC